jgi:hypothetical protein
VEKVSDHGTIGPRNFFEFPENISPRKKKIVIIQIKGGIQRKIHTMHDLRNAISIGNHTGRSAINDEHYE